MGISRSPTIVLAYLISRYNMSLDTAYSYVKTRRPQIRPNPGFMDQLRQYETELKSFSPNTFNKNMTFVDHHQQTFHSPPTRNNDHQQQQQQQFNHHRHNNHYHQQQFNPYQHQHPYHVPYHSAPPPHYNYSYAAWNNYKINKLFFFIFIYYVLMILSSDKQQKRIYLSIKIFCYKKDINFKREANKKACLSLSSYLSA